MSDILEKIGLNSTYKVLFETASIIKLEYYESVQTLKIEIEVDKVLPFDAYEEFIHQLKLNTKVELDLTIKARERFVEFTDLMKYYDFFAETKGLSNLLKTTLSQNDTTIEVLLTDDNLMLTIDSDLSIMEVYLMSVGILFEYNVAIAGDTFDVTITKEASKPLVTAPPRQPVKFNQRHIKYANYANVKLANLNDEAYNIAVEGQIFDVETRELRNGSYIVNYYLRDEGGAIVVTRFYDNEEEILEKGTFVCFYGDYIFDNRRFVNDYVFKPKRYEIIGPLFEREDLALDKRVEFHLHTKISEMDGVTDIKEYLEQAFAWEHPGLVITDHEGVQSFPKAYNHLKKLRKSYPDHAFKLAYGVEMNIANKDLSIVTNPKSQAIQTADYVVFDIETTGLSAYYDHIIEFGAVKISNGQTVDSIQLFIKPPISIPINITEITNISDADVKGALSIEDSIDTILDFIGDAVLVAHNASFDIDFMQEILRKLGREPLDNTYIDTLDLSRALFTNRRSYRLGNIARMMKITYDDDIAHRADYDAEVLSNVFFQMKRMPELQELHTVDDLFTLGENIGYERGRKSHVSVIAKNQAGLKSLYELVSLSYTKYLATIGNTNKSNEVLAEPRIIKSEIDMRRENLLIGAGCINSDVFEIAMNKSQADLERVISYYDFVEIMPLANYQPLLDRKVVDGKEGLIRVVKRIIATAKKLGVMILATGDVHYNHPNDKVIRDIYIHSQGIGGTRHPLYTFNTQRRLNTQSPDQHFRTTTEMLKAFDYLEDDEVHAYVIDNPVSLLSSIDDVVPVKEDLYTPQLENSDALLMEIVYENAHKIYGNPLPTIVKNRIDVELKSILGHGFGVIYYISHLLVKKSLDDGYLVGSRGSVGSSLVATMAEITEVNPLMPHHICPKCHHTKFYDDGTYSSGFDLPEMRCPKCNTMMKGEGHDIPFETFLGFEGDKVPDIDLNFSGVYQEHAHAYTKELFGEEYVYRAGTISTVAQKTAFGYVKGYFESMEIDQQSRGWQSYLAYGAEGVKRTTGQHPGGIIVVPNTMDVHDFTPVQYPANNKNSKWLTTHFEFHDIDSNVLKLDILGHVDPTAMKMLEKVSGIDINTVPINDPKTISLFASSDALEADPRIYDEKTGALGIPEFGTSFVRKMLEATRPDNFSDLVRISGLSHGTDVWRNNAEELIKEGLTLKDVIGCRDDIMVTLMHYGLQPKMAFDIMESVRKGRGLTPVWEAAMKEHNLPSWYIDSCKKIKYMFPKAHAVAYVMMAMRVAWFKVHSPLAYYAVYFTLRVDAYEIETMTSNFTAVSHRLQSITSRLLNRDTMYEVSNKEKNLVDTLEVTIEMLARGYEISPISLMYSEATEFVIDPRKNNAIIPPFNVIDGLGDSVAASIVAARNEREIISKHDLMSRSAISSSLIKKLDELGVTNHLPESNQMSLFDL